MLPYVGFFPCEIMFQPLADDFFFLDVLETTNWN